MYKYLRDVFLWFLWSTGHPRNFQISKWQGLACITWRAGHKHMVQITHDLNGTRVWHMWSEPHTCGFLRWHMCVHAHTIFTHTHVFTRVHACMANVAIVSYIASYLPFSLNYNVTVLVTLIFLYRALAAHQGVQDKIMEEVESTSLILLLATSYLTDAFLLPEVTIYYTKCSVKSHHWCVCKQHKRLVFTYSYNVGYQSVTSCTCC